LAQRIGHPPIWGRELLRLHRETYRDFWRWYNTIVDQGMLVGRLHTVFGWQIWVTANSNERSLRNFPMQANGAEMLRLACSLGTERGIEVCAPIHDAVLIAAPLERLDEDVARMQAAMQYASRIVLNGFELGSDAKIVRHPDRYSDPRGSLMWNRVMQIIHEKNLGSLKAAG
jgi:DNA polymerase I